MILMDTQDVMKYLDVSKDYVRWIREDNLLKMWKIGRKWRTSMDDVNQFLEDTKGHDLSGRADIRYFAITHKRI